LFYVIFIFIYARSIFKFTQYILQIQLVIHLKLKYIMILNNTLRITKDLKLLIIDYKLIFGLILKLMENVFQGIILHSWKWLCEKKKGVGCSFYEWITFPMDCILR
jgi:hypothetical protein